MHQLNEFRASLNEAGDRLEAIAIFADWLESNGIGPWQELRELTQQPSLLWIPMLRANLLAPQWRAIGWEILARAANVSDAPIRVDPANRQIGHPQESMPNKTWQEKLINDMINSTGQCDDSLMCQHLFDQLMVAARRSETKGPRNQIRWICGLLGWQLAIGWIDQQEDLSTNQTER